MAADLVRFVDSIAASPTLRLDLNDETAFWVKRFDAPPPRLRRSMSDNSMRDGIHVGSSSYGARTLVIELECRKTTQDLAAVEMQKLWRELDRAGNVIMYQPNGLTKPVFFRTYRSDTSQLVDVMAQAAMRDFTVEVLAEPFALGLKETLGPFTVSNNPVAATNPCYVDLPTILGDVATPFVYWDSASGGTSYQNRLIGTHSGAAVTTVATVKQIESWTAGTDTTNPGGGPDAAMSGTGTNNFLRTSFATSSSFAVSRASTSIAQPTGGAYHLVVGVRRSGASSTLKVRAVDDITGEEGPIATVPPGAARAYVDLGIVRSTNSTPVGYSGVVGTSAIYASLRAERTGGSETLDWDVAIFIPAGSQNDGTTTTACTLSPTGSAGAANAVVDGTTEQAYMTGSAVNPTTTTHSQIPYGVAGGFPAVAPGKQNRLYVLSYLENLLASSAWPVSSSTSVNLAYWPRYLFVRPVSS